MSKKVIVILAKSRGQFEQVCQDVHKRGEDCIFIKSPNKRPLLELVMRDDIETVVLYTTTDGSRENKKLVKMAHDLVTANSKFITKQIKVI